MEQTFFEAVGGETFFNTLVDNFYIGIESDEVLSAMYKGHDLTAARRHLALFLQQYWGGPSTYQEERGHPRLRMRHFPFAINADARDRWLTHMKNALDNVEIEPHLKDQLWTYLVTAAHSLMNTE